MTETLFAWLGDEDLDSSRHGNWPGPIGQAVRERRFDRVILLSDRPTAVNERFVEWLDGLTNATIEVLERDIERSDLSQLFDASKEAVEDYLDRTPEGILTFHLTPGTAMTGAIWIILAKLHFDAQLITSSIDLGVETVEAPEALTGSQLPRLVEERQARIGELVAESVGWPNLDDYDETDPAFVDPLLLAHRAAPHDVPVLVRGESGTGRARFAQAIHHASPRAAEPLERIDPRGVTADELLLEIFGQTEIVEEQPRVRGKLETAGIGAVILERLELFPMRVQVELLRVLETRMYRRLQAKRDRELTCRFFVTIEGNPTELVQSGVLHEGLLLRLSIAVIHLPPLRERGTDLSRLIQNLWDDAQRSFGGTRKTLSATAMQSLLDYDWPGNVRELRTVLMRSILWSDSELVHDRDVRRALDLPEQHVLSDTDTSLDDAFDIQEHLDTVARHYVERALIHTDGNKTQAADLLGLSSYQTLTNWMKRLGVTSPTVSE